VVIIRVGHVRQIATALPFQVSIGVADYITSAAAAPHPPALPPKWMGLTTPISSLHNFFTPLA